MAEYIEREAAYEKCGWYNTVNGKSVYAVRKDELAAIPAADVAPVRHARWEIIQREGCFDWCCCSNCGEIDKRQRGIQTPYCWHCGAKMAEEKMDCVSDFWR